jgi:hypothetical protein
MKRVEGHWLTGADYLHKPGRVMPMLGNPPDPRGREEPPRRNGP